MKWWEKYNYDDFACFSEENNCNDECLFVKFWGIRYSDKMQ